MNKTLAKKYQKAISSIKNKYVTVERLSHVFGRYPDIIAEELSFFDPLIRMDISYNVKDLLPVIEEYLSQMEASKDKKEHQTTIKKKMVLEYDSVADFVYKKMTVGGLVDRNIVLSDTDLRILKKIIGSELAARRKK